MRLPAKVSRSTMAAQKRASVKVLVQPLKLSMLVIATALVSSLGENLEQKLNASAIQHHVSLPHRDKASRPALRGRWSWTAATSSSEKTFWSPSIDPLVQRSLGDGTAGDQRSGGADDSGRLHPTPPFGFTSAIVSSVARRKAQMVADIAGEVGLLEQQVMAEAGGDHPRCRKCQREMIMQARVAASPS
jgi:hypothetical protein